jgi:hypothetical protein
MEVQAVARCLPLAAAGRAEPRRLGVACSSARTPWSSRMAHRKATVVRTLRERSAQVMVVVLEVVCVLGGGVIQNH